MARRVRWNKQTVTAWLQKKGYGELVDDEFKGTRHRHTWRCKLGHEFPRTFDYIKQNDIFCSKCEPRYRRQEYTRFVFQQLTEKRFHLHRNLDWLRDDRGERNCIELDGYNEELSIAFEYDGGQHVNRVEEWHDETQFANQQRKDKLKDTLCKEKGVVLIRIGHELKIDEIEGYVTAELQKNGLGHLIVGTVDNSNYRSIVTDELLREAREYAEERGGECRSELILTASDPVTFYCPIHDHEWTVTLSSLRNKPSWCYHCSQEANVERLRQRNKQDFEERRGKGREPLDKMAANFPGYQCLSDEYDDGETEYQWKCPEETHPPFLLTYNRARDAHRAGQPHICSKCNKKDRITIGDMEDHAKKNGGTCLTKELDDRGKTVVRFKCGNKEHEPFTHTATAVKNETKRGRLVWCPDCPGSRKRKHDLAFAKSLCEKNNCELLSEKYHENTTKMKIKCKKCGFKFDEHLRWMQRWDGEVWCDICIIQDSD